MLGIESKKKFSSPEDEIVFLRAEVAKRERALLDRNQQSDDHELLAAGTEAIRDYAQHDPVILLTPTYRMKEEERRGHSELIGSATQRVEEIISLALDVLLLSCGM